MTKIPQEGESLHRCNAHPGFAELSTEAQDGIVSSLYLSRHSGMRIILNQCPSPVVSTAIIVPTLGTNDEGEPHCLEHLVFRGSRNYPAGFIDSAAQHFLSDGTNAYTATDRTVYLVSTAGVEGAAAMIPVFLDHVFYPLLTQMDFDTEVFHVSEDNENAGVVFSEMESAYSSPEQIIYNAFQKACYEENCPLRHETGGHPLAIPSLTLKKVQQVHQRFYMPSKVTLLINGQFDQQEILKAVASFEVTLEKEHVVKLDLKEDPGTATPQMSLQEIAAMITPKETSMGIAEPRVLPSSDQIVFFNHETDEGDGFIFLGFRGPDYTNIRERLAMEMLGTYLTEGNAAPLVKHIIDCDTQDDDTEPETGPLAADVTYHQVDHRWTACCFQFEDCTTETIRDIKSKFSSIIHSLVSDGGLERFDLRRMQTLIRKRIWEDRVSLESDPHSHLEGLLSLWAVNCWASEVSIRDQVFSEPLLTKLKEEPAEFWKGLISKYLVEGSCYTIIALPSTLKKVEKTLTWTRMKGVGQARQRLERSKIKEAEAQRDQVLMAYLKEHAVSEPDPTRIKLILGDAYMHGDKWKYDEAIQASSNPLYFVDMQCHDKDGSLLFTSEFVDLSLLVPIPDTICDTSLLTLCKKEKKQQSLDLDIADFLKDLKEMDFELSHQQRQEAIKLEMEEYKKTNESGKEKPSSHESPSSRPPASSSSDEGGEDEDGKDIDFELSYCLKFVLDNFTAGKLLNLLSKSLFNNDIRLTKSIAKKLEFPFSKEDVDEQGFVVIGHARLNEKLNEWAVEFDSEQGLGSSAVFENVLHINWKVKKEHYADSLLLLRTVLEHTVFDEERLVTALRKELAGISSDLRSGSGVIPGILWLDRYKFHSVPLLCNRLVRNIVDRVALKYPELFVFLLRRLHARVREVLFSDKTWLSLTGNSDFIFRDSRSYESLKTVFPEYFVPNQSGAVTQPLVTPLWKHRHPELYTRPSIFSIASNTLETGFIHLCVSIPDNLFPPDLVASDNFEIWKAVELVVTSEFLRLTEGPIFKPVRESGTCYAPRFNFSLDQKGMALLLEDSIKPVEAFKTAIESLRSVLSNTNVLLQGVSAASGHASIIYPTEEQFVRAKAATVHSYVDELTTPIAAADASLDSWMRRLPKYVEIELLQRIRTELSYPGFLKSLQQLLTHFFDQIERGLCQLVCHYPAVHSSEVEAYLTGLLKNVSPDKFKPQGFHETIADTLIFRATAGPSADNNNTASKTPFLKQALIAVMQARLSELNDTLDSDDDDSEDDDDSDDSSFSEEGLAY